MPTPLPGMNPYLEDAKHWPVFHKQMIAATYQVLLPGLVDRYRARIVGRSYTSELVLFTSVTRETHAEEWIEIRSRIDGRLITLVDVVSIANRTTAAGQKAYLATREEALNQRANVVEIDLVTQGKPPVIMDRTKLPASHSTVSVTRGNHPDRHEIYTSTIQKRLPKFKLPLASDDRDTVYDLQQVYQRAYDLGGFEAVLQQPLALPPDVKLSAEDLTWLAEQFE